ncbi:MAG: hypothetical protein HKN76_00560 [Saprospiraceae bacterium]|nr:hypothetical protein [Saprospiraceae bacterium]
MKTRKFSTRHPFTQIESLAMVNKTSSWLEEIVRLILPVIILLALTSCEQDEFDTIDETIPTQEVPVSGLLTGEEIEPVVQKEGLHELELQAELDEKFKSLNLEAELLIPESQMHARSRYYYPLNCGYYNIGRTTDETNTANFYPGPDRIYFFTLTSTKQVNITLSEMRADHDLFLTNVTRDALGRMRMGSTITTSLHTGWDNESIDVVLPAGRYFMIVDSYRGTSSFKLKLNCSSPAFSNRCENHDELVASYSNGISRQSSLWRKWSPSASDGKVLYEGYSTYPNKVVKFDQPRFGYQDVVRSMTNYHIIGGAFEMDFDLYIPSGKKAEFVSEKLSRFGAYGQQGFYFKLDNGRIYVRHGGRYVLASTRFPTNRWFKVKIIYYMNSDRIYIRFDDNLMVEVTASRTVHSRATSIRSIWGLNFTADSSNSKFHIDNICVKRYSGSGSPWLIGANEMISLVY